MMKRPGPAAAAALLTSPGLAAILSPLDSDGEETRIVGGAIRNALLDRPIHEIDLATTALPETVMERARAAHLRFIPTGLAHGTITLLSQGHSFEITTLREDVATDGRHAQVRFGRDFSADAQRRDFTINAFSMDRAGQIYDYVGGFADLEARRVRFIGQAMLRITEDYLRILRFFRFSADFTEGPLDADGLLATLRQREGLRRLSAERVHAELFKLLCARRAAEVTTILAEAGLLAPLLGLCPFPIRLKRLLDSAPHAPPDPLLRLAALCLTLPETALILRDKLRLSNEEFKRLLNAATLFIGFYGKLKPPDEQSLKVLLFKHGRQASLDALSLAQADAPKGHEALWEEAKKFLCDTPEPKLPFSGKDILAHGIADGPAVGQALKAVSERWIKAGFPQDPESLRDLLATLELSDPAAER